ncbi:MAG: cytochrome C [Candidatus Thermoplasmatota archaeon]
MQRLLEAFHERDANVVLTDGTQRPLAAFLVPAVLLMTAALLVIVSAFMPYWSMALHAPQYPQGLRVNVFVDHLDGDVGEIDELNHYLGLASLDSGGQVERALAWPTLLVLAALLSGRVFLHGRWADLLAVPTLAFPLLFLGDLWFILYRFGHSVDPTSALGGAVGPFTPPLFGAGHIGQFSSTASAGPGLFLCIAASALAILAVWRMRIAFRVGPPVRTRLARKRLQRVEARR